MVSRVLGKGSGRHGVPEGLAYNSVEALEVPGFFRLRAEMKVPGRVWLQWETQPQNGGTRFIKSARFAPNGLSGILCWNVLFPAHAFIFSDLIRAVGKLAMEMQTEGQGRGGHAGVTGGCPRRGGAHVHATAPRHAFGARRGCLVWQRKPFL